MEKRKWTMSYTKDHPVALIISALVVLSMVPVGSTASNEIPSMNEDGGSNEEIVFLPMLDVSSPALKARPNNLYTGCPTMKHEMSINK